MSIAVGAELETLLAGSETAVAIVVRGAMDFRRAAQALRDARAELAAIGSMDVSAVVGTPEGPMVVLEEIARTVDERRVIAAVRDALSANGVTDAEIGGRRTGGIAELDRCPNAVVLRLFPQPAGPAGVISPDWIDLGAEWLLGDLDPHDEIDVRILGVEFAVEVADAPGLLHQATLARAWCDGVTGDFDTRIRTASVTFGPAPHLAIGAGGPAVDSNGLLARFELLQDVAREFAPTVAYACIDLEPTFEGLSTGLSSTWRLEGGASPHLVAGELGDIAVPDVYPYQVLGPGHLVRLTDDPDADPDDPPIGEPVGSRRFEVVAGDTSDWLPIYGDREEVQVEVRSELEPLLLTAEAAEKLREARDDGADLDRADRPVTEAGGPDPASVTIEAVTHARRGTHLSVLEFVSWLDQQPHSDDPGSVSTVLSSFVRLFGQGLDDDQRQRLKDVAPRLLDTDDASSEPPALGPLDTARAWMACDWSVRAQGEAWLRAAGLTEAADRLAELSPVRDNLELVRAVEQLGAAVTIASRRIDITLNIASGDPDEAVLLEQISWDAWERASEASAWVAATEAASRGIPTDLLYATDLRVIECSRDPRVRDEMDRTQKTVADHGWAAALGAVAELVWQQAWDAAEHAVYEASSFSMRTVLNRSAASVGADQGLDEDQYESQMSSAEEWARAHLADAALRGGTWSDGEHPWDAACRLAREGPGGDVWGPVLDSASQAVGELTFGEAMDAARAAADEVLKSAPDVVGRTVAVAVAREAASAAGRGLALRAAAVSRAHGADEVEAEAAADDALAETVSDLREAAFALLDELVDPGPLGA